MKLVRASVSDCDILWGMQIEAFRDLLEKYQDYETSPASEPKEKVEARLREEFTYYYFIIHKDSVVGAIRVVDRKDGSRKRVSPIFIMKEFRGKGLAQRTFVEIEKLHGSENWTLAPLFKRKETVICMKN